MLSQASVIGLIDCGRSVFYKAAKKPIVEEKPVVFTPQNGANREVPQAKEELYWNMLATPKYQ